MTKTILNMSLMRILFIPLITILLFGCNSKGNKETGDNPFSVHGDTISLNDQSFFTNKLKTQTVKDEPFRLQMLTAGEVAAIPTQYAEIAPPFSGRVTKSYLKMGMKTTPQTPLFEISSPDFINAQKIFFQEKSQLEQADKTLKRQKDLMAHGVGTQKDLEEAQTAYDVEKKEYENAVIGIRIFKADPDHLSFGQPLVVRSPIAGEVLDNKVVMGQYIKDDAASVATVADLSKVWIVGQVKEKDIRYIHKLDDCTIEIAPLPEKHIAGKVYHVKEIVDESTRSIQVLVEANNADRTLKPGMYVTINFIETPVNAILIPAKALFQMNDANFVFVVTAEGKFIKTKVITGGTQGDRVVINSGLSSGEKIVSEGGFYLLNAQ